jgi:hypothetical protein
LVEESQNYDPRAIGSAAPRHIGVRVLGNSNACAVNERQGSAGVNNCHPYRCTVHWGHIGSCRDAVPTKAPEVMVKSSGTLNVGQKEVGPYFGSPKLSSSPQIFLNSEVPITETLRIHAFEGDAVLPMLAESWEVSADGIVWTLNIRQGIEFHKGYGEITAEDVQFSLEQVSTSEKHARSSVVAEIFFAGDSSQTINDT